MNPNWIRYFNGQNNSNTQSAREVTRLVPTRDQGRKTLGREWGCDCEHKRKIGYMDNVPLPIPDRHINRSEYCNWSLWTWVPRQVLWRDMIPSR